MRILIAEDDMTSRFFMKKFLSIYGDCDIAVDGAETVTLYKQALEDESPFDLICLDIMMPKLDGLKVLKEIRAIETKRDLPDEDRVKVIMTSAINDKKTVMESYEYGCHAYAWKPIDLEKFREIMVSLDLIEG